MWLEVKLVISIISWVFIAIVLSQIILLNFLLGFLLIVAIGLAVLSDMLIGYQIKHNHADKLIDPCPANKELGIMFTLTGLIDFLWVKKAPHGKREFVYNGQEASYINNGDYPIHSINGNYGSIVHESYDENLNMFEVKAAEKIAEEHQSDDIKEIYERIKQLESKEGETE